MQLQRVAPFVLAVAVLLSACGDSSTASTSTVVDLTGTAYATLAPTQSTIPSSTTVAAGGSISETPQEYTIKDTDTSRQKVADYFGITVAALDQANIATPGYSAFYAGLKIIIPAGAKVPSAVTETTTPTATTPGDTTATTSGATTTTVASNGDGCTTGSYVITADDTSRTAVAEKFDITVDQLDAANANTKGYSAFYPGLKIIIPCA